jgi:hypothetical protein
MTVSVVCPRCKKSHDLADTLAGKEARCDSCGEVLRVPAGDEAKRGRRKSGTPAWANAVAGVFIVLLLGAIGWILFLALGSSVTPENLQKLKVGMTEAEVKAVLGSPNKGKQVRTSEIPGRESTEYWIWTDGPKTITVIFAGGKVVELQSNLQPTPPPQ